jgi:hypothetical protein
LIDTMERRTRADVRTEVESLLARLPAAEALGMVEHLFGVLPLLEAFFEPRPAVEEIARLKLGALGLFTPAPEPGWEASAVEGVQSGEGLLLRGRVRVASPSAEGTIVLVRQEGPEHRLAWVDGERLSPGGTVAGLVSRPVQLPELFQCLEKYAGAWALGAAICASDGVRALRRFARTSTFNASQLVAMDVTELEIEAELALIAARSANGGLATAAASARILAAVIAKTAELRDLTGLEIDSPLSGNLIAFLGGPLMIESELARKMGIR